MNTLCDSCDVEVFKKCRYVHFRGEVKGMKKEAVRITPRGGEAVNWEKVVYCPNYKKEAEKMSEYICKVCGSKFYSRKKRDTCSAECQAMSKREDFKKKYKCKGCGKWFESKYRKDYCSNICKVMHGDEENKYYKEYKCEWCGKKFKSSFKKRFCGAECRGRHTMVDNFRKKGIKMFSWKKSAEGDLRDYEKLKVAVDILPKKIQMCEDSMVSLKGKACDRDPVKGGTSAYEDNIISSIVLKEKLIANLKVAKKSVTLIEKGLDNISSGQRRVIELFYFANGGGYRRVMDEFNIEQSEAYRRKDEALRAFTIAMYGIPEL